MTSQQLFADRCLPLLGPNHVGSTGPFVALCRLAVDMPHSMAAVP